MGEGRSGVDGQRGRRGWLAGSAVCGVAALWLDYTCLGVIIPLALWVLAQRRFGATLRAAYLGVLCAAQAAVTPLLIHQASTGNPGADAYAHLTWPHAVAVIATPVDGRYGTHVGLLLCAAVALWLAIALGWRAEVSGGPTSRRLLLACAVLPLLALFVMTLVAKPVLLTRYGTVAVPFEAVLLAGAVRSAPRLAGPAVLVVAVLSVLGSVNVHRPGSRWPAIARAYAEAGGHWRSGDRFLLAAGIDPILLSGPLVLYDSARYLPRGVVPIITPGGATLIALLHTHHRLWFASSSVAPVQTLDAILAPEHLRVSLVRRYVSQEPIQVSLVVPER